MLNEEAIYKLIYEKYYDLLYEKYYDLLVYGEFKITTDEIKNILKENGWISTKNQS